MVSAARHTQVHSAVLTAELARRTANGQTGLWPGTHFARHQPPSLSRLRAIIDPEGADRDEPSIKLARATTAALMSTNSRLRDDGNVNDVLSAAEQQVYRDHNVAIQAQRKIVARQAGTLHPDKIGRVCGYCDLLSKLAHGPRPQEWPSLVINHAADVAAGFDPDTLVSSGRLVDFKILTRDMTVARSMVLGSHPLMWSVSAPMPFKRSEAAERRGRDWYTIDQDRDTQILRWRNKPNDTHYLYEYVESPWNEYVSYQTENIIRIENFNDTLEVNGPVVRLSYDYFLESPLRSNFGVAWEQGGLDVDRGEFKAKIELFNPEADGDKDVHVSCGDDSRMRLADAVIRLGWQDQACKVTLTATKALRYTTPREGPRELRSFLNYTSPALICTFLNHGFVQPVHQQALQKGR